MIAKGGSHLLDPEPLNATWEVVTLPKSSHQTCERALLDCDEATSVNEMMDHKHVLALGLTVYLKGSHLPGDGHILRPQTTSRRWKVSGSTPKTLMEQDAAFLRR